MSIETREKRAKEAKKEKLTGNIIKIVGIVLAAALVGGIIYLIVYNNAFGIKEADNYSLGIAEDGKIADVNMDESLELCDFENIIVTKDSIRPSDEEIEDYINSALEQHEELNEDTSLAVANGDKINLDYVGSVDGVEFDGGSTDGAGTDIVVGEAGYIDDFEDQLVGHKVGENFDINVTFPDPYESNEELSGKDAVFNITINGIYSAPEFTDAFVAEYYGDEASTVEEFKQNYIDENYDENLDEFLKSYIIDNSNVVKYPEKLVKNQMSIIYTDDYNSYVSTNNMYIQYMGAEGFSSFEEYNDMSKKEYYAQTSAAAQDKVKNMMVNQAIYEKAGLTVSEENIADALDEYGVDIENASIFEQTYGKGYTTAIAIPYAVMDYLRETVKVTE